MNGYTYHRDYRKFQDSWQTLRDAEEGTIAIRAHGERYLPRPGGFKRETEWENYLRRPEWFNATKRTIAGLTGAVFRKTPNTTGLESLSDKPLQHDITGGGIALGTFLRTIFGETLHMGRYGVLLDTPAVETPMPALRWAGFCTEDICDWAVVSTDTQPAVLQYVVLREHEEIKRTGGENDLVARDASTGEMYVIPTQSVQQEYLRVLSLDNEGFYRIDRFLVDADGNDMSLAHLNTFFPVRQSGRLDFIPFVFFGPNNLEPGVDQSPVWDLVRINLRHWRHSADYEHGLHFTGLPTPWVTGHNPLLDQSHNQTGKDTSFEIVLGSGEALMYPEADARVGLLSLSDAEFSALRSALENDKKEMATLGARLLEDRPDIQETATALRLRHAGDESVLKTLALTVSEGSTRLARWHMWWAGQAESLDSSTITIALNTDFMSTRLSAQDITALMALQQEGAISSETLYYQLEQGEITEPGITFEQEQVRVESRPPVLLRLGDETNNGI